LSALVVNMFAGPGAGKSTMRASVFAELKWLGIDCEEAPEFAKDLTWEERFKVLANNQDYVYGKQLHRIMRLVDKVEVVVTDSPIVLSIIYDSNKDEDFHRHVIKRFNSFDNLNIFIERFKPYNPNGRSQTIDEAIEIDNKIKQFLSDWSIDYITIPGERDSVATIVNDVIRRIEDKKLLSSF
jgi:hypothetical protein